MLMDTRQLAAFCAVVERKSFSQAAERLGVTQPAVSLQIRSLEQRLGRQLLDRSGRRVEPTEAGLRLYASAQRLLALEESLLEELAEDEEGVLSGTLELGASTGPGGTGVPLLLCEVQEEHPELHVRLTVSDTQTVVDRVADRELELGVVGAGRRHRGVVFEPFFRDEVVLACPPDHPFAGKTISLDQLKTEPLIVMQEGAGVRQVIEDELRKARTRLRDLDVRLELRLQESAPSADLELGVPIAERWGEVPSERVADVASRAGDAILAVGGGSAIDLGKAASAEAGVPVVSIPTTYAGAEWTPFFGIRDPERRMRGGGSGAHLAGVLYEPELTLSLPRAETVGTALNALAHSAEALYVEGHNPEADEHALEGARLIGEWLPRVVDSPQDLEARTKLLEGAMHSGMALGGSMLALGHAIAQAQIGRAHV